ncbi:hypothetical protein HDA32_001411 [Spinactinospora alkalitolerans]|uniref:DUF4192 domain-containing protein n=1 Tax=Spinactinospora alkalitolerans TaxID=687207 RepID=A0A852TRU7_9ACTN|nr:DUF4192 domain-containing protein [Spinactinospora alkalitolerans]NYE46291.1 hypothetical protein [Spinactinospora alkalitolerans]
MVTNGDSRPNPVLTLSTPTDIIAAIPFLLGFHPGDDVIVIGLGGRSARVRLTTRCDLPADPAAAAQLASTLIAPLGRQGCDRVLAVGYGPAERVTPCLEAVREILAGSGVRVAEALRVQGGRYWSHLCGSPRCCPPGGTAYDVGSSAVPAGAVAAGLTARRDREDLAASIAPIGGRGRADMERATLRAETRCARLWGRSDPGGHAAFEIAVRAEGVRTVRRVVAAALGGDPPEAPDTIAWLGVLLLSLRVRDEAWAHIRRERAQAHVLLWRHVLRRIEPPYSAAPGSLLAFAAWLSGDGVLADLALDRVDAAVPGYSMAELIRQALRCGVSPGDWRHFTPEWLEGRAPVAEQDGG